MKRVTEMACFCGDSACAICGSLQGTFASDEPVQISESDCIVANLWNETFTVWSETEPLFDLRNNGYTIEDLKLFYTIWKLGFSEGFREGERSKVNEIKRVLDI